MGVSNSLRPTLRQTMSLPSPKPSPRPAASPLSAATPSAASLAGSAASPPKQQRAFNSLPGTSEAVADTLVDLEPLSIIREQQGDEDPAELGVRSRGSWLNEDKDFKPLVRQRTWIEEDTEGEEVKP